MKNLLFLALPLFFQQIAQAQEKIDSPAIHTYHAIDTSWSLYPKNSTPPHIKEWIVPAVMITYGALAPNVDALYGS